MPARTGAQFKQRLKEQDPQLFLEGQRVKDATTQPGLRNGVDTLAQLYDLQHDPALLDEMTYVSPTTGDRVGLSFITPHSSQDLEKRHQMMRYWARVTAGMTRSQCPGGSGFFWNRSRV